MKHKYSRNAGSHKSFYFISNLHLAKMSYQLVFFFDFTVFKIFSSSTISFRTLKTGEFFLKCSHINIIFNEKKQIC